MKNLKKKILLLIISIFLLINLHSLNCQNLVTGDYSNMNGIQIYFVTSSSVYLFGSFLGSASQITGTLYLFMSDTQSNIDSSNGVWAGVGFGSSDMYNSDMVMCTYMPGNKFGCYDAWSTSNSNPKTDASLGGKNDITASSGTITSVSVSSYKTLITFTFTKDISNVDKFDWSNFATWQTNKGGVAGAYGYLNGSQVPLKHPDQSNRLSLTDGSGYTSSISVSLGAKVDTAAAAQTATPTATGTTTAAQTVTPTASGTTAATGTTTAASGTTAATGTTTAASGSTAATGTTKTSTGSSNGAKGLKAFDVFAAVFCCLLVILI